jgi:hypothetical protein
MSDCPEADVAEVIALTKVARDLRSFRRCH